MHYQHSLELARDYADQAIECMRDRNITPHPNNFTIWYSYASGEYPDLAQVLDILIDNNQEFSEERNASVFNKFCANPFEALPMHMIAEKMESELAAAMALLQQAGDSAAKCGDTIEKATQEVRSVRRAEDLLGLLNAVLTQTRAMSKQSRDVEGQLRRSWAECSHLKEELAGARQEAMTDALTGLSNRKMFDFALRETAMEAMESGETLSILFLDIDHFKAFNDSFGHSVGDQVLKLLATVLRDTCKGQDTPARYGGEEFAVILPRTRLHDAARLAESIRCRVAGKTVVHRKTGEHMGRVQVSIGVAEFVFGEPLRQLVERADRALYEAKRTGRNRVVVEEAPKEKRLAFSA
jgi:diguanylate cyclase